MNPPIIKVQSEDPSIDGLSLSIPISAIDSQIEVVVQNSGPLILTVEGCEYGTEAFCDRKGLERLRPVIQLTCHIAE